MKVSDYFEIDGEPKKCVSCKSSNLKTVSTAFEQGFVAEAVVSCGDCGERLGEWAYGHWNDSFVDNYETRQKDKLMKSIRDLSGY